MTKPLTECKRLYKAYPMGCFRVLGMNKQFLFLCGTCRVTVKRHEHDLISVHPEGRAQYKGRNLLYIFNNKIAQQLIITCIVPNVWYLLFFILLPILNF
jgi:hypothetical protein